MAQLFWEDRTTDLDKVPSILEYVYSGLEHDISDAPSFEEYKKLKRIMKIMVRFYKKGSAAKQGQYEDAVENLKKIDDDLKMLAEQLTTLNQFPDFHPKKKAYVQRLLDERDGMQRVREPYQKKADEYESLKQWSDSIVEAVQWLENEIEEYCNAELKMSPPLETRNHKQLSPAEIKKHAKGLDEITYNLQESQDFFDASVDGRLQQFHQIEKCMIMAQLAALKKWPEDSARRAYVEEELKKDMEFVESNMHEDEDKKRHKHRMRSMHRDFWAVLRWQRRKLKKALNEPDIESEDGALKPRLASAASSGGACPGGSDASGAGKCPVAGP